MATAMPAAGTPARSAVPSTTDLTPIWHPSPNFSPRRDELKPSLIVLHFTAMESASAALDRLRNPEPEVSAHYLIGSDGSLWQLVREVDRAWHAGAGEWNGQTDINSRSIGIELDNRGDHPFSEPQMGILEQLLPEVMRRWSINPEGVIGHSDMAPNRKTDPGPRFDWQRLELQGLAAPRGTVSFSDPGTFRTLAQNRGYTATLDDDTLLAAIRLRYRPWASGSLHSDDLRMLGTADKTA